SDENEADQGEQNDKGQHRPGLGIGIIAVQLLLPFAALAHDYCPAMSMARQAGSPIGRFATDTADRAPLDPALVRPQDRSLSPAVEGLHETADARPAGEAPCGCTSLNHGAYVSPRSSATARSRCRAEPLDSTEGAASACRLLASKRWGSSPPAP